MAKKFIKVVLMSVLALLPAVLGAYENVEIVVEIGGPKQGKLSAPSSVAFDENGRIYVADTGGYRVRVFAPDGTLVKEWGEKGKGEGQLMEPFGIACAGGQVFVTDFKLDKVVVYDTAGKFLYEFGGGAGPAKIKSPKGIAISGQGRLYVAESGAALVSVYTPQGLYLGPVGPTADGANTLNTPSHLALDRSGNLYVSDSKHNRIQIFNSDGKPIRAISGDALGIQRIAGVAVTPRGFIIVADNAGRIFLLTPEGKGDNPFGSPGQSRGQFWGVGGIAIGPDGRLAVADAGNDRVVVIKAPPPENAPMLAGEKSLPRLVMDPPIKSPALDVAAGEGGLVFALIGEGMNIKAYKKTGPEKFKTKNEAKGKPNRMAAGAGRVYVSDFQNHSVTAYSQEDGKLLFKIGGHGKNTGQFNTPGGLYLSGKLYVADTNNNRIQVFSADGVFLKVLGESADLKKPGDVTVGPDGKIYIADTGNKRIVRLTADGKMDGTIGDKEMFGNIVALRVDEDGRIFVLEGDGQERIRVLSRDGKIIMRIGVRGSGPADFMDPGGMDYSRGALYIADTGNGRILRINILNVPAEPDGLKIAASVDSSVLTWRKGTESFLKGYRVYAVDESGKKETLDETDQTEFTVSFPLKGGQTRFTVSAFSRDGLESTAAPIVTDWARIGWNELQAGRYKEATVAFEKALKADPNDPFALDQMGRALIGLKQFDQAKAHYEKLSSNRAFAGRAYLGLGMVALAQGKSDEAEKLLQQSLGFNSQDPETQLSLAELSLAQRNWQNLLDYSREAAVLDTQNARSFELLGLAYFNLSLYGKAAKAFSMAISLTPKNPDLYLDLARVYRVQGQNKTAEEMLAKAIQTAPDRVDLVLELGVLYLETDKLVQADEKVDAVIKAHPDNAAAYRLKGKIFFARGKKEDAVEAFQKALKLNPDDPEALVGLATGYLKLGNLKEAASFIEQARTAHPKDESVLMTSSKIRMAQGDMDGAVHDLNEVLENNPASTEALLAKGRILLKKKEYKAAAEEFAKASKMLPGTMEPMILLAEAQKGAGRQVEAEETLRNALNINMDSALAHHALGALYASRNDFEKAIPELKLAAYIEPDNAEYQHALGNAYMESSELDEAVLCLQRASELKPGDEEKKRDLNLALDARKKYRSSRNVPPVEISQVNTKPIFAGIYKSYQEAPVAIVTLKNNSRESIFKVKLSFKIKGYMDQPTNQVVDSVKPRSSLEIPLKANLSEKVLSLKEDTPVLGTITVEYTRGKSPQKLTQSVPFTIYGANAIVWSQKAMTGAFVTQGDWPVAEFARGALEEAGDAPESLQGPLFKAAVVYQALSAYKMSYLEDPNRPYRQTSKEIERVDYVQFPRDTLRLRSGDCDDLSVLFAALMENLGVETAIADVPGHVIPMVNAGVGEEDISTVLGDPSRLVVAEGKVWIPIEVTVLGGSGFNDAWAQGAITVQKAKSEGKFGIILTHDSWKKFAPATLQPTNWKPTMPEKEELRRAVEAEITLIARQRIERLAADLLKQIEQDPNNLDLKIELGVLYAKNGDSDKAQEQFDKVLAASPNNASALNNLGNLLFLQGNFQAALEKYRAAEAAAADDAEIKMNLAMTYYRMGNMDLAKEKFEAAVEVDPDLAEANEGLKELLYH